MNPYYQDDQVTLYHGDCLDVLAELPDNSVDSVCTDPPYGLDFMGKHWDTGAVAFDVAVWGHALRVLKPGGHLLAFGGSRTWHRLAAAIEDAGFEIRDSIAWLYGSGMPKSLDVSKAIDRAAGAEREVVGPNPRAGQQTPKRDTTTLGAFAGSPSTLTAPATDAAKQWQGWGTALKPSHEPVVVARKPLAGTVAANVLEHGTGALNIDACRIGTQGGGSICPGGDACSCTNKIFGGTKHPARRDGEYGRWPTNVVLDDAQAAELDAQTGVQKSGTAVQRNGGGQKIFGGIAGGERSAGARPDAGYGDSGGASRFFPVFRYEAKAPGTERPSANGVAHPTVKPLDLMRWLVRLVTPPNGVVLDPFAGSGTTAEACIHEHKRCITIEREADYLPLIVNRLSKPIEIGFDFEEPA
ncbi:DNA methylase [Mycobacterium phage Mahavrat]|uniref:DNA methylase n=1 Tax=Mycobacterium phage Mahavrat TaxID=2591129 RepID=A0A515MLA5_9CAUD|nr:DNA methyltransferase [Mycobacterium phage Mahavrat]QDM57447.1 DNA methylase [Mycobacterium phage Mahavrat]